MSTCPAWDDDGPLDLPRIVANVKSLWPTIEMAAASRPTPVLAIALDWHRAIHAGVAVPDPDYVANIRDSDPTLPCLIDYEVVVGTTPGVPARDVPASLDAFLRAATTATSTLDGAISPGVIPIDPAVVSAVIRLCAFGHGEWIRIHPFANGNGRTARIWANWVEVQRRFADGQWALWNGANTTASNANPYCASWTNNYYKWYAFKGSC